MNNRQSVALVPLLLLLFSCQELFTTSLAAPLARNPSTVYAGLATDDLSDPEVRAFLLESLGGDADAALALLERLETLSATASGDDALLLADFAAQAAGDALNLAGAVSLVFAALSSVPEGEEADLSAILESVFETNTALEGAADALVTILPAPDDADWDAFVESASDDSLIFAGLSILFAQALDAADFVDYVDTFDAASAGLNTEEALAVDLLTAALGAPPDSLLMALLGVGEEEGGID